jgi:AraC-like DNA-binding protein
MIEDSFLSVSHLSSDDVPKSQRIPMWRDYMSRHLVKIDIETDHGADVHFTFASSSLGDIGLLKVEVSAIKLIRRPSDGDDHVVMSINCSGELTISSQGRVQTLLAKEAVLWNAASLTRFERSVPGDGFLIRMPRKLVEELIPNVDIATMMKIPQGAPALNLLIGYLQAVLSAASRLSADTWQMISQHVSDLVAAAMGAPHAMTAINFDNGVSAARMKEAHAYIAHNAANTLSLAELAKHLGVTTRQLQRLFEAEGTTFSAYLLEQRLALAFRLLSSAQHKTQTIQAIAFNAGFKDLSYFNRSFRAHYGLRPRDVRDGRTPSNVISVHPSH